MSGASPAGRPPVTAIAAIDLAGGLARGGTLPWRVPSDLKRFRRLTLGEGRNAVIMGRLTWTSPEVAGRPLPKRLNVVLTRRPSELPPAPEGVVVVGDWEAALAACAGCEAIWVVGGAGVYAEAFARDLVDAVELTTIGADFGCDLFWPGMPPGRFVETARETREDAGLTVTDSRWEHAGRGA
jgi:dihydrofolate reductase